DRAPARLGRGRAPRAAVRIAGEHGAPDLRAPREQARRHPLLLRALPREVLAPRLRLCRDADPALAPEGGGAARAGGGSEGPAMKRVWLHRRGTDLVVLGALVSVRGLFRLH